MNPSTLQPSLPPLKRMGACASVEPADGPRSIRPPPSLEVVLPHLFRFGEADENGSEMEGTSDEWFSFIAESEPTRNSFQRNFDGSLYPPSKAAVAARVADFCSANPDAWCHFYFARGIETLRELDELFAECREQFPSKRSIRAFSGNGLPLLMKRIGLREEPHVMYLLYNLTVEGRKDDFRTASPSKVRDVFDIDEWSVSLSTWRRGLLACGVMSQAGLERLAARLGAAYGKLTLKDVELKSIHRFVFRFMAKDAGLQQVAVCKSDAVAVWRTMLLGKWLLLDDFCEFVENVFPKKFITVDQWDQLVDFASSVNCALHLVTYNPQVTSWPTLMDDFVAQHQVCTQQADAAPE